MERSSLQNTYLRQSHVLNRGPSAIHSINRSFINTGIVNDSLSYNDDLRKSRIQNLPNYKKANLGQNIQFIVVFQTIQIQRLSNEVQLLRVKLKENERQLFNTQNYEVQIRQLTERCFSLEREREQYRQEIDNMNKICETLYHQNQQLKDKVNEADFSLKQKYQSEKQKNIELSQQIDKWKNRYQASQKSKTKELEDLRNLMQCQRKSMVDREIREITIRFQTQRSNLENQIRKCREMLQNRQRQIDEYKQKCQKYQITIMELRNYENVIADNENKIAIINQQLIRLNEVLRSKEDQIHLMKQSEYKLNQQIKQQKQWQYENKQLKGNLENRQKEIDQWKVRVSRLEEDATRGRELSHFNNQLSNKLALTTQEIERLNGVLKSKYEEIEEWKRRLNEKDMQVNKYKNLENDLAHYQSKMNMLKAENQRINGILKSRLSEIEEWRAKHTKLQLNINNLSVVEKDKKTLQAKYSDQLRNYEQLKSVLGKMEADLRNHQNAEGKLRESEKKNENLSRQLDRLNNVIRNNGNELNDLRTRYSNLESKFNEYRSIQIKLKDYENKVALLTQEIERLNTLNRSKNQDIQNLEREKIELHQKMTYYKNYQMKINQNQQLVGQLNNQVRNLKNDIEIWKQKYIEADGKGKQRDNEIFIILQEKDKFANMLRAKNSENDDIRTKYSRLEDEMRDLNELKLICQEQHNQISAYLSDINMFEKKNGQLEREVAHFKSVSQQLNGKVSSMSIEIERVQKQGMSVQGVKNREIEDMREGYTRLQSRLKSKDNDIDILMNKITHLESKIGGLTQDFMRLLNEAEKSDREHAALVKRVDEYQDYARRIHILGAQIDRLTSLNQGLQDDVKKMRLRYANQIHQQNRVQSFNFTTVMMAVEIESLRMRLEEKGLNQQQMRKSILQPVRRI